MADDISAIGKLIRSRRIAAGMSQARLAAVLHHTPKTVRRWERGEAEVPDEMIPTLAAALDIDEVSFRSEIESDRLAARAAVVDEPMGPPVSLREEPAPLLDVVPPIVLPPPPPPVVEPVSVPPPPPPVERPQPRPAPPPAAADVPTQTVAAPPPLPVRPPARTAVAESRSPEPISYLEDPKQRRVYALRWIATALILAVLAYAFVWAAAEIFTVIDDVLDFLTDEEDPAALAAHVRTALSF